MGITHDHLSSCIELIESKDGNAPGVATVTKEVATITKKVLTITKEVATIIKEVATITKEVATITKEVATIKVFSQSIISQSVYL